MIEKTESEWREQLTPEQYRVLRQAGTERAFTGQFWNHKGEGVYACAACGAELFDSTTKFDSGCGWPSFFDSLEQDRIVRREDNTHGMRRVEVLCASCHSHLGHIFPDAPQTPTGERYCINSVCLTFAPKQNDNDQQV